MIDQRYEGKPFLKLLDSYVLDAIGELSEEQKGALSKMEPKLNEVYEMDGSWQEIVSAQMELPSDLPAKIKSIWEGGASKMRAMGMTPEPWEFTREFVDLNFPH